MSVFSWDGEIEKGKDSYVSPAMTNLKEHRETIAIFVCLFVSSLIEGNKGKESVGVN